MDTPKFKIDDKVRIVRTGAFGDPDVNIVDTAGYPLKGQTGVIKEIKQVSETSWRDDDDPDRVQCDWQYFVRTKNPSTFIRGLYDVFEYELEAVSS